MKCCKILRSLDRVFVFKFVKCLCIGALSKDPARFVDSGFVIFLKQEAQEYNVSAANPHLLRFLQICPRLATFWSFSLLRRNRRPAAQSQDQTYIFLMCQI